MNRMVEIINKADLCPWCGHPQDIPRGTMSIVNDGEWTTWSCPDCHTIFATILNSSSVTFNNWKYPIMCCGKRLA